MVMNQMEDRQTRLKQIALIADTLEAQTRCPAALMIAQWALESEWGDKLVGRNNCFGMKREGRHTEFCTVPTHEVIHGKPVVLDLEFADYDSVEDSCRDYAWLITHGAPYRAAWEQYQQIGDLQALIRTVAATYATDPNYARLITTIAGQTNITQALAEARQERSNAMPGSASAITLTSGLAG